MGTMAVQYAFYDVGYLFGEDTRILSEYAPVGSSCVRSICYRGYCFLRAFTHGYIRCKPDRCGTSKSDS
jgi:hypothetical protein